MHFEYFILLFMIFAGPFALGFSRKLKFYAHPGRIFLAILIPAPLFLFWDSAAAMRGHWHFNPAYVTGLQIGNLPLEEILFFAVVPFCALFTWECVKWYGRSKR